MGGPGGISLDTACYGSGMLPRLRRGGGTALTSSRSLSTSAEKQIVIRQMSAIPIPVDFHIRQLLAMGGFNRVDEVGGLGRVCSSCHFKFEPGPWAQEISRPGKEADCHGPPGREEIRYTDIMGEPIETSGPEVARSRAGSPGLAGPRRGETA